MWVDDDIIKQCHNEMTIKVFSPKDTFVVLGSSNKKETETHIEACKARGIKVEKRYGGGGTVVLYPGCVVVSIGVWVKDAFLNKKYFCGLNKAVIKTLFSQWQSLEGLCQRGISDIAVGDKKVAGTSLFRSRNYLLYQASLLMDLDLPLINTCLSHPSREPEYRKNRSHGDFLVGLRDIEPAVTSKDVIARLQKGLPEQVKLALLGELIEPDQRQIKHLLKRAGAS